MKIAFVTDDSITISSHFGRAKQYVVVTIQDGNEINRTVLDKSGHGEPKSAEENLISPVDELVFELGIRDHHIDMITPITDCDVVIGRGMGHGAHKRLTEAGIDVILTAVKAIDEAVTGLIEGTLEHDSARLHSHHGHHH